MSNTKGNGIAQMLKSLIIMVFKAVLIAAAFVTSVLGMFFTKCSELLNKISGNGAAH